MYRDLMKTSFAILLALLAAASALHAAPRASTAYSIASDRADAGGKRATSVSYTNDGSVGGVAGQVVHFVWVAVRDLFTDVEEFVRHYIARPFLIAT